MHYAANLTVICCIEQVHLIFVNEVNCSKLACLMAQTQINMGTEEKTCTIVVAQITIMVAQVIIIGHQINIMVR